MNRRALVFSLLAVMMSGLFLLAYAPMWSPVETHDIQLDRVKTIENDIDKFSFFAKSTLSVSSTSALEAMFSEINETGTFYQNFSESFLFCMLNSTHCSNNNSYVDFMTEYTHLVQENRQNNWSLVISNYSVVDMHRWDMDVFVNIELRIVDKTANWVVQLPIKSTVSFIGLSDPAFVFINNNFGGNKVRRFSLDQTSTWNYSSFTKWYGLESYHAFAEAPCIYQRYEGDFDVAGGDCGVGTLVSPSNHDQLLSEGGGLGLTHLDFRLFSGRRYACEPGPDDPGRVGICDVDEELTLTYDDAALFNLTDVWCDGSSGPTAVGC